MKIANFSIKHPILILGFWIAILFLGIQSAKKLPVSFMPNDNYTHISVLTNCQGAGKHTVLEKVTKVLESELKQLEGIQNLYSTTQNELSSITIDFERRIPQDAALASVVIAASRAKKDLPEGVGIPVVDVIEPFRTPLFIVAATSDLPEPELYDRIYNQVKPIFEDIQNVAHVEIIGAKQKQATVVLDLEKMRVREISATEVVGRLNESGMTTLIENDFSHLLLGEFSSLNDLGSLAIHFLSNDKPVLLREIAEIREEITEPKTSTYYNGKPCLFIEVYAKERSDRYGIEKTFPIQLQELKKMLSPQSISLHLLFNQQPNLIPLLQDFLKNTSLSIAIALLIICFVFRNASSIFVASTSIPTSLCGAFIAMQFFGLSINVFTVLAIIVSVGLIIDDMMIIRENIFRHLEKGLHPFEATRQGVQEMIGPVIGTTCTVLAAALSLIFIQKNTATQFLSDFGTTMFWALGFSFLEALTLGPVLCAYCLSPQTKSEPKKKWIQTTYEKYLQFVKDRDSQIIRISIILLVCGLFIGHFVRSEGDPIIRVGNIEIHTKAFNHSPEIALQSAQSFTKQVRDTYPDIESIGVRVDRDKQSYYLQMVEPKNRSLTPTQLTEALQTKLETSLSQNQIFSYYLHNNVFATKYTDYGLELSSANPEGLKSYADKIWDSLQQSRSLVNLENSSRFIAKEYSLFFDRNKMNSLGVAIKPMTQELIALVNQTEVAANYHPPHKTDALKKEILVKSALTPSELKLLSSVSVPNLNNTLIPLDKISSEKRLDTPYEILRKNGRDLIQITGEANPTKKIDAMALTHKIMKANLPLPKNIFMGWSQTSKLVEEINQALSGLGMMVFGLIYLTLILLYQSITLPFIILFILPFSMVGSLIALLATGYSINTYSIIGIVLSTGIAARNGIILLTYAQHLIEEGIHPEKAIFEAALVRLRPILMTTCGVVLTTIPIFIAWKPYNQVQYSLGIAIIGGLICALSTSLFLLPALFKYTYTFHRKATQWLRGLFNSPPETD